MDTKSSQNNKALANYKYTAICIVIAYALKLYTHFTNVLIFNQNLG